jgi:hypothetical protein
MFLEEKSGQCEGRFDDLLQSLTCVFESGGVVLRTVARRCHDEDLQNDERDMYGSAGASEEANAAVFAMRIPTA